MGRVCRCPATLLWLRDRRTHEFELALRLLTMRFVQVQVAEEPFRVVGEVQAQFQAAKPVAERVRELVHVYCLCPGMSNHLCEMRVVGLTAL